jgi:hypothetical protein
MPGGVADHAFQHGAVAQMQMPIVRAADGELLHGREPLGFTVSMILSENRVTLFGIMLVLSRFDSTIRYRKTIGEDV